MDNSALWFNPTSMDLGVHSIVLRLIGNEGLYSDYSIEINITYPSEYAHLTLDNNYVMYPFSMTINASSLFSIFKTTKLM